MSKPISSKAERGSAAAGLLNFFSPVVESVSGKPISAFVQGRTKGGRGGGRAPQGSTERAYQEVFDQQMEEVRLRNMLNRIQESNIIITFPTQLTPFSFPVKVDSIRETLSSEKLEDRVRKMIIIN